MTIETVSVDSIMLYFGDVISEATLDKVQEAYLSLKNFAHIVDLTPSYTSILVQYNLFYYDDISIKIAIQKHLTANNIYNETIERKTIEVIVDYSKGLDLQKVADFHKLSTEEVIRIHTQKTYRVYAIGFMVGFAYLAQVDKAIQMPRLSTPRTKVPKGSVAIAQTQTAIYPQNSAGGWHILGSTNFENFNRFSIGDSVRFIDARL